VGRRRHQRGRLSHGGISRKSRWTVGHPEHASDLEATYGDLPAPTPFSHRREQKRLQLAVLAAAVLTLRRLAGRERAPARRLFAEVEAWFASDDADTPFTFIGICESLKLDPAYIRPGLSEGPMHIDTAAKQKRFPRRDGNGTRHQVVLPRLRRVA